MAEDRLKGALAQALNVGRSAISAAVTQARPHRHEGPEQQAPVRTWHGHEYAHPRRFSEGEQKDVEQLKRRLLFGEGRLFPVLLRDNVEQGRDR